MTNSQAYYDFLSAVRAGSVTTVLAPADLSVLQQMRLVQVVGADQYKALQEEVAQLGSAQSALAQDRQEGARLSTDLAAEAQKTHSVLFHFEGGAKKQAELDQEARDRQALQSVSADLAARQQQVGDLVAKQSLLSTLIPYAGGYVGLTGAGQVQLRDMAVRLYRISDVPFETYLQQSQQVESELNTLADLAAQYAAALGPPLAAYERSNVWALSIGLAKQQPNVPQGAAALLQAWNLLKPLSHNEENRLMAAEIVATVPRPVDQSLPPLQQLDKEVRHLGVPKESSLGVAAMLLLGQRQDGTFATSTLQSTLQLTRSYESAALLAILNVPLPDLTQKFQTLRALFGSWGFQPSEDVELASAFLAVSELPVEGLDTKLAIIARGMGQYLQFPLVASAILAALPTLEANETLSLLEQAYDVVGRRAMPMSEPELITLAVRLIHGIRDQTISELDTTARVVPRAPMPGGYLYGPRFFFVPVIVAYGGYHSTFGGVAGIHPAHTSVMGGGFGG